MEIPQNIGLSGTSVILLNKLQSKQITLTEFLRECAYWALRSGFDELHPKPYPTKPQKALELEQMSLKQRLVLNYQRIYIDFPEVENYYKQRWSVKIWNKAIFEWLEEIKGYIPQEDELSHRRIDERIEEFRAFEDGLSLEAERLKETFDAEEA